MRQQPLRTSTLVYLAAVLDAWLVLFHLITENTWGYGRTTFAWYALAVLMVLGVGSLGRFVRRRWPLALFRMEKPIVVSAWILVLILAVLSALRLSADCAHPNSESETIDIGANTIAAGDWFLEGQNPYANRAQVLYDLKPGPKVVVAKGRTQLYGVPYANGYPYFPVMFLFYLPFRFFGTGADALRFGNAFILLASLLGIGLMMRPVVPRDRAALATAVASIAFLEVSEVSHQAFDLAITDFLIAPLGLYAFYSLDSGRPVIAGVLFGIAQATKLLPAPFLIAPALLWLWGRPEFRRVLVAYVLTSLALLGPFVAWHPKLFYSSTFLFYLANHAQGDNTSLWFFLPASVKPVFSVLGYVLSTGLVLAACRRRADDVLWPFALSFTSYLTFVAFAQMCHVNYLWEVYAMGCTAIVALAVRETRQRSAERDPILLTGF